MCSHSFSCGKNNIMAGHSKFKNIMHRKGAQDKKRAAVTTRLVKEITVATRLGGTNLDANPRLRLAISQAKANNVGKEVIERALARGEGSGTESALEEIRYEGYGPKGIALIIEVATDNRNRSAATVRGILSKHGGSLAESGSVTHSFERVGLISYQLTEKGPSEEQMFELALEAGAKDVSTNATEHKIITEEKDFHNVCTALESKLEAPDFAGLVWLPKMPLEVTDREGLDNLLEALDEDEDIQAVFTNSDSPNGS